MIPLDFHLNEITQSKYFSFGLYYMLLPLDIISQGKSKACIELFSTEQHAMVKYSSY